MCFNDIRAESNRTFYGQYRIYSVFANYSYLPFWLGIDCECHIQHSVLWGTFITSSICQNLNSRF